MVKPSHACLSGDTVKERRDYLKFLRDLKRNGELLMEFVIRLFQISLFFETLLRHDGGWVDGWDVIFAVVSHLAL